MAFVKAHINIIDETGAKQEESKAVVSAWIEANLKSADLRLLMQHITVKLGRVEDGAVYVKSYEMVPVLEGSPASYAVTNSGVILSGSFSESSTYAHRKALYTFLFLNILSLPIALELPERFRVSARDIITISSELTLVGSSYWTNEDAIRSMLSAKIFGSKRVAVVRDLFDRHLKQRPFLDSVVFALEGHTTIAILDIILGVNNPKRRLVQEYVLDSATGSYNLTVNDMELGEYAELIGYKVLPVPEAVVSGPISLLPINRNKFLTLSSQAKLVEFYQTEGPKVDPKFASIEYIVLENPSSAHLDLLASAFISRESSNESVHPTPIKHTKEVPIVHKPFEPYRDATARQTSNKLLMVAPIGFLSSAQTALDNYFMNKTALEAFEVERLALAEYASFHAALVQEGVNITLYRNERFYDAPDAVFPNNWFSTHPPQEVATLPEGSSSKASGVKSTLVLYPMKAPARRAERREHIISYLIPKYDTIENLSYFEYQGSSGAAFEGTGSLVIDRVNKVAYCALSQRADAQIFHIWCAKLGYTPCVFEAFDALGRPIYHTNVLMGLGTSVGVVCAESVKDDDQRKHLLRTLEKHHTVVQITIAQMNNFCGNILEVAGANSARLLVMSTRAFNAFTDEQHQVFARHVKKVVHVPVTTIEYIGGGGVRCMMGELF